MCTLAEQVAKQKEMFITEMEIASLTHLGENLKKSEGSPLGDWFLWISPEPAPGVLLFIALSNWNR